MWGRTVHRGCDDRVSGDASDPNATCSQAGAWEEGPASELLLLLLQACCSTEAGTRIPKGVTGHSAYTAPSDASTCTVNSPQETGGPKQKPVADTEVEAAAAPALKP
eukprot:CAMPEP_0202913108 /NCGR_PEP_ID=MMETSP1392-20130828/59566_1 /ASSEMBLY_ACC=CAM_ASM_000868 /TAXON_ID=225041 /ORGANISM="Chlamydomonas chlamydogama, Strain SAG 11-48b" /LENGTH=106 /DNA_ID=CAMNT_0049604241 /DNA_START=520 /DNA_END=840 /DNA_ORIENTATION=+